MDSTFLTVEPRTAFGKKLGALRRQGITPIHVYGRGIESLSLQVDTADLLHTLARVGRTNPFTVRVDGTEHFVMVREVQLHPVTERILHLDLLQVSRTERLQANVPVALEGEAPAARQEGAMLVHDLYEITVEALPMDLPSSLTVDVSGLTEVEMGIHARDVALPSGVTLITDLDAPVARVVPTRIAAEEEEVAPTEEALEEAAAAEEAPQPSAKEGEAEP